MDPITTATEVSSPGPLAGGTAEGIPSGAGPLQWLSGRADRSTVVAQLYDVIDPEVGVNIVDLGLLYQVRLVDDQALIQMTLTTPGCPLGGYIEDSIDRALFGVPGVSHVSVDLVWDPPWGPELMSDEAKRQLGWQ